MKRLAILTLAAALIAGCDADTPAPTEASSEAPAGVDLAGADVRGLAPAVQRDLARARAATAQFHRFERAEPAGHDFLFLDMCMENQPAGGMGYHYVNLGLLLDGVVEVERPEALMYEPGPNGQMRLVGLEYVIRGEDWTSPDPPVLFGREFVLNQFDLWALHVWIWKHNPAPDGVFADWNPTVSCEYAGTTSSARHH